MRSLDCHQSFDIVTATKLYNKRAGHSWSDRFTKVSTNHNNQKNKKKNWLRVKTPRFRIGIDFLDFREKLCRWQFGKKKLNSAPKRATRTGTRLHGSGPSVFWRTNFRGRCTLFPIEFDRQKCFQTILEIHRHWNMRLAIFHFCRAADKIVSHFVRVFILHDFVSNYPHRFRIKTFLKTLYVWMYKSESILLYVFNHFSRQE